MQKRPFFFLVALFCLYPMAGQTQEEAISMEGTLLMLDDKTPHVAVPVQAIRDGGVTATTLSDENGGYQLVNLKPGRYQVRCQVLEGYVYYQITDKPLLITPYASSFEEPVGEVMQVANSRTLKNIDFRFAPFKKGIWKTYTYLDGLVDNPVFDIYRDPDGVIWFATNGGVSQYDGGKFVGFTIGDGLAHNNVGVIYRDPTGVLWFGSTGGDGVFRYDGEHFVNFTTKDGLVDDSVQAIYRDPDGVVWFATDGGVSRYNGKEFANLTTKDGLGPGLVRAMYHDPNGLMWFGSWGGGVSRYDGKEFINFTTEDGLVNNMVNVIHRDNDGVLWFGTWGGISRYDGKEFANYTTKDGLVNDSIWAIYQDPDDMLWFGTWGGISRYDGKGFVNFTTKDGLANDFVYAIHRDPDGVMWFGTRGGVSRYKREELADFTTTDGLVHNNVNAIHRDLKGVMWFGTFGGVSRYDGKEFVNLTIEDGLAHNNVNTIHQDADGMMWFGTWGGISRYDGESFVNFAVEDGFARNDVRAIHRDADGVIWSGRWWGISRYDGKEFVNLTTEDGLAHNNVLAIHGDADGVMWFGTWGGVSRYDGKEFVNLTTKDGLAHSMVSVIHTDPHGLLWFGTNGGGISRYDGKEFTNFTKEDGLTSNTIAAVNHDMDGFMWFGSTNGGVSRYDGTAWASLDTRDGLAGNNVSAIHQDPEGFLWFATENGITRYHPSTTPPKVRIVSITTDKTYHDLSIVPAFTIGTRVTFEYDAIDFKTLPEKQQYRYRIRKADSDWRKPTKTNSFDYTFHEPGTHTFEVQAIDRDLNYSEPQSLEITILPPPFYTRAGFIIGAILIAFLIPASAFAAVLIRQRRQVFETISNPYIVGNPVRTKEMFFGRESDFEFVRAKLATGQSGLVIVFAGERRSGKTSILFQILEGALGEQFVPVLLDMQAMAVNSEAEFLGKMASDIGEALVKVGHSPISTSTDFHEGNPIRVFEQFMAQSMDALGGKSLLLLLDEYELIETKMDDGVLRPDLITFFASLLEAHPHLSFIFTGSRHLEGRKTTYWRVLIGKSLYRRISFLSEKDALRLITEPVAEQVTYPGGIPERIVRLTGGQPFYTQVVCQNLIDRLNEVERTRVRQEDMDAVADELTGNPLPQMIYFWDGLEQDHKNALSLLGEVLEDPNRYASAQMLVGFVQKQKLGLDTELSELRRVLNDLFVSEVLERERAGEGQYDYRFRADLFRLWVRQAHSIWE